MVVVFFKREFESFFGGEGKEVKKREPSECRTCQIGKGDADCIPRVSMDLLSGTYTNSVVAVERQSRC